MFASCFISYIYPIWLSLSASSQGIFSIIPKWVAISPCSVQFFSIKLFPSRSVHQKLLFMSALFIVPSNLWRSLFISQVVVLSGSLKILFSSNVSLNFCNHFFVKGTVISVHSYFPRGFPFPVNFIIHFHLSLSIFLICPVKYSNHHSGINQLSVDCINNFAHSWNQYFLFHWFSVFSSSWYHFKVFRSSKNSS